MGGIDILIVGGGPTGMTLALELVAQKIPFRIIEKATQRSTNSRALVVQPRTQELLNRHGNVRQLLSNGFIADGASICVAGKKVADIATPLSPFTDTAFPSTMAISQFETEQFLEKSLTDHGIAVEMGVEAKSIEQDADGVTVRLAHHNGNEDEIVRAKYVVGADGAHSVVRHAAKNLTFEGASYSQEFILADTRMKSELPANRAYICLGMGVMVIIPMKDGLVRLVVSRPGHASSSDPKLDDFEKFMHEVFPGGGELYDPSWITRFHLHHRGVNDYRDGKLFVAGDAAHIHSPAGGQGMNTGIQDAVNLGWKLAAVIRGERPESFLDSYNAERRPVGRKLLQGTDKAFTRIASTNRFFVFFRNLILPWILPWVVSRPQVVSNGLRYISELNIRYRKSSIVGTAPGFTGPIKGGSRVADGKIKSHEGEKWLLELLTAEMHHLVLFSGVGSGAVSEGDLHRAEAKFLENLENNTTKIMVHTIFGEERGGQAGYEDVGGALHRKFGFDQAGYVLVRPDSYVAHIGHLSRLDDALNWFKS